MRNDTGRNKPERPSASNRKSPTAAGKVPGGTSPQYSAQERERMQAGLRILARIISSAHLRRQASGAAPVPPPDYEVGD